jgi:hypothetical protein
MAFTRFNYDECRTKKRLQQSTDVGNYYLNVPGNGDMPFFIEDPNIRIQKWGGNLRTNMVDIESNLKGVDKTLKCDTLRNFSNVHSTQIQYPTTKLLYTEQSRTIQPAWNLRGIETTKSEYLYYNPQIKASIPFMHDVSSRNIEKDLYNPIYKDNFRQLF